MCVCVIDYCINTSSLLTCFDYCDDRVENIGLVSLHDVSCHHHFVDYKVCLLYVEHYLNQTRLINCYVTDLNALTYIELANIFEVLVQGFDHIVDEFE